MSNFIFAIGVHIPNHSFKYPLYFSATTTASITAGAKTFTLSHVSPTYSEVYASTYLKRGDIITLTSSHTSYSGYTEQAEVVSCTEASLVFTVTVKSALSYSYNKGDTISGYGSGFPDGWIQGTANVDNLFNTTIKPHDGGYGDDYAFYARAAGGGDAWVTIRDFDIDPWLDYTRYRIGCWTKSLISGSSYCGLKAYDGVWEHQLTFTPTEPNVWEEKTKTFTSYYNMQAATRTRTGNVDFRAIVGYSSIDAVWFYVDDIYLEHIRGVAPITQAVHNFTVTSSSSMPILVDTASNFTSGSTVYVWGLSTSNSVIYSQGLIESIAGNYLYISGLTSGSYASGCRIEQTNDGYYELEEYPDMGVEWERVESVTKQRTINNTLKLMNFSGWGERASKINIKMNFSNVDYTFYQKMKVFEDACRNGSYTNIHGLSTELPEIGKDFLQGCTTLTNFKHDMWSRQKVSFTLTFEEV